MENHAQILCVSCGTPLVQDVTSNGVVAMDGHNVQLRRHTDHVVCSCLASYRVVDLRQVIAQVEARMRSKTAS